MQRPGKKEDALAGDRQLCLASGSKEGKVAGSRMKFGKRTSETPQGT